MSLYAEQAPRGTLPRGEILRIYTVSFFTSFQPLADVKFTKCLSNIYGVKNRFSLMQGITWIILEFLE